MPNKKTAHKQADEGKTALEALKQIAAERRDLQDGITIIRNADNALQALRNGQADEAVLFTIAAMNSYRWQCVYALSCKGELVEAEAIKIRERNETLGNNAETKRFSTDLDDKILATFNALRQEGYNVGDAQRMTKEKEGVSISTIERIRGVRGGRKRKRKKK